MNTNTNPPSEHRHPPISVIVPVTERPADLGRLHGEYRAALEALPAEAEFIYVLDGERPKALAELQALRQAGEQFRVLQLGHWVGEAGAISAGFGVAQGEWIFTLPAYYQVRPDEVQRLWTERAGRHMAVGFRYPRRDASVNRWLGTAFNSLVSFITGTRFHDLGCGARLFHRSVLEEIALYGDQHRFLPVLASLRGFSVIEVPLAQSEHDLGMRGHGPGVLLRRVLDLMTVFFLARFTKKPLRFFGLVGSGVGALGLLWAAWLIFQRLVFDMPLADRPALMLASLLIVLGVQVFALGLVGEIVIFTHAREIREYAVEEVPVPGVETAS
jgi:hypothetical protein